MATARLAIIVILSCSARCTSHVMATQVETDDDLPKLNVQPRSFYTKEYKCNGVLINDKVGRNDLIDRSTRCHAHPCFPRCDMSTCSGKMSNEQVFKSCKHCYQSCFKKDRQCHFGKTFMLDEEEDGRYMQCIPLGQTYTPMGFITAALRPQSWFRYGWSVFYEAGSATSPLKLGIKANIDTRLMGFSSGVKIPFIGTTLGGYEKTLDTSELQVKVHIELPNFEAFKKVFEEGFPSNIGIFVEVLQDQDQDGVLDDLWRYPKANSESNSALLSTEAHQSKMKTKSLLTHRLDMKRHQGSRTSTGEHCFLGKIMSALEDKETVEEILKYVKGFDICAFAEKVQKEHVDNDSGGGEVEDVTMTFGVEIKRPSIEVAGITVVSPDTFKLPLDGKFPILTLNSGELAGIDCPDYLKSHLDGRLCPRGLHEVASEIAEALKLLAKDVDEASEKEAKGDEGDDSVKEQVKEAAGEKNGNEENNNELANNNDISANDDTNEAEEDAAILEHSATATHKTKNKRVSLSESTTQPSKAQIEEQLLRKFVHAEQELRKQKHKARVHAKKYGHSGHHALESFGERVPIKSHEHHEDLAKTATQESIQTGEVHERKAHHSHHHRHHQRDEHHAHAHGTDDFIALVQKDVVITPRAAKVTGDAASDTDNAEL